MEEERIKAVLAYLARAEEALTAATGLLDGKFYRDSVSRSYYAMFYAATAALLIVGQKASSHAALVAQFGEHLVKAGHIRREFGRMLNSAMDLRGDADYDVYEIITEDQASKNLRDAQRFVGAVKEFVKARDAEVE